MAETGQLDSRLGSRLDTEAVARLRPRAAELIARYPKPRSALLPLLHLVQSEQGYVSGDGIAFCAEQLGLTKAEVAAVATFYTMFKRRPTGDWLVSVCTNTMCGVLGGDAAYQRLSELLGVGHDETTEDGSITLEHAECLAACDYAPVMTVNYEFFDRIDPESAVDVVETLRRGKRPVPTRGARLCTFKEMSLQLAGFFDEREGALGEGPAGEPTLAGNRLAERHGVSVAGFDPDTPIGGGHRDRGGPAPMAQPGGEKVVTEKDAPAGEGSTKTDVPTSIGASTSKGAPTSKAARTKRDTEPAAKSKAEARKRARTPAGDPRAAQAVSEGAPDVAGEPGVRKARKGAGTAAEAEGAGRDSDKQDSDQQDSDQRNKSGQGRSEKTDGEESR